MNEIPVILARQPILAGDGKVYGYELLYRGSALDHSGAATVKSARVLCEALSNPGLERVVGDAHMFVNFDQELLASDVPLLLPRDQGVVEIVENVEPTSGVIATLNNVRRSGIGLALDDFQFQANLVPFIKYVDYIKVDIQDSADQLEALVRRLKQYGLRLIAEKVETSEQVVRCRELGFQLFQGYYFARPEPLRAQSIDSTRMGVIALIADLQNPEIEAGELAERIGRDLGLTHRILKLSNSAAYRRQKAIGSIADAVVMLGQDVIRQWASLLLMTQLTERKPLELFSLALVRARMCQAIGSATRKFVPNELYTVGLLSVLDALLDRSMDTLVAELPLADSLREALCGGSGSTLADILRRTIAYTSGDWAGLGPLTAEEERQLPIAYSNATYFARLALCA